MNESDEETTDKKKKASVKDDKNNSGVEWKLVNQLFEAIIDKLIKNEENSSFFLKFDFNSFSKKINKMDFFRAMQALDIRLVERDIPMIARVLDADNSGFFDLGGLMQELAKKEQESNGFGGKFNSAYDRMGALSEIEEKAIRSILDEIHMICKKSEDSFDIFFSLIKLNFYNIIPLFKDEFDYLSICKSKDFYKQGSLILDDFKFINKQLKLNFIESDYDLLQKKYDKKSTNEINYDQLFSDMESPYKGSFL